MSKLCDMLSYGTQKKKKKKIKKRQKTFILWIGQKEV